MKGFRDAVVYIASSFPKLRLTQCHSRQDEPGPDRRGMKHDQSEGANQQGPQTAARRQSKP
jgi:hypothetical protein